MLRKLGVSIAILACPSLVFAIEGAITRPAEGAIESQAARTQQQVQPPMAAEPATEAPADQTTTTTTATTAPAANQPVPYQFAAAPYFGLSLGPRNTYNGKPAVSKGLALIGSAGAATMFTNHLYFAGEIFLDYNGCLRDFSNPSYISVQSDWSLGLDVIPGYMLTTFILGYLRIGVETTKFTQPDAGATAWRLGIGGQTNICKRWDLRAEYVYSGYKRISIGRPHIDQFNLGLVYKFT